MYANKKMIMTMGSECLTIIGKQSMQFLLSTAFIAITTILIFQQTNAFIGSVNRHNFGHAPFSKQRLRSKTFLPRCFYQRKDSFQSRQFECNIDSGRRRCSNKRNNNIISSRIIISQTWLHMSTIDDVKSVNVTDLAQQKLIFIDSASKAKLNNEKSDDEYVVSKKDLIELKNISDLADSSNNGADSNAANIQNKHNNTDTVIETATANAAATAAATATCTLENMDRNNSSSLQSLFNVSDLADSFGKDSSSNTSSIQCKNNGTTTNATTTATLEIIDNDSSSMQPNFHFELDGNTVKVLNALLLLFSFGFAINAILNVDSDMSRGWTMSEKAMRIPLDNWSSYESSLNTQPILTKTTINVIIYLLGDWLSQTAFVQKDILEFDATRTLRNGLIGMFFGPLVHQYYEFSDTILPVDIGMNRLYKILMDQTLYLSVKCSIYIIAVGILSGETLETATQNVKNKIAEIMLTAWKFWPLVHCVTYNVIPARHRILWVNCVDLIWNAILALKTSGQTDDDDNADEEISVSSLETVIAPNDSNGDGKSNALSN
mmetsp:Transcript_8828/g.12551  ORF Transcript_8828/g.12551 Transcript_8828/m.12551 type:complete len:548 (+) Transcript_8828:63-1706(+)